MSEKNNSEKLELLKFFYESIKGEVDHLRMRQDSIFSWSSNVFIALIGALLIIDPTKISAISSNNAWSKLIASLALLVFIVFSVIWQQRIRRYQGENAQVMWKIERYLHCYDTDYFDPDKETALFPERWHNTSESKEPPKLIRRVFRANNISATLLLGFLAILMIWVSGTIN